MYAFEAMILAAGLGTRLRPITENLPKALVEVGGEPVLGRVVRALLKAGADRLIVNVHHHQDQIRDYLESLDLGDASYFISAEPQEPLETGGGVMKAKDLFERKAPFLLHNVDVLSDIDLAAMYRHAVENQALAHLAVMPRETNRYLLFDEVGLCGHGNEDTGSERLVRETSGTPMKLGFAGLHVISPRFFELVDRSGPFSIIPAYMDLAAGGERILPYRVDDNQWIDIGTHDRLIEANAIFS